MAVVSVVTQVLSILIVLAQAAIVLVIVLLFNRKSSLFKFIGRDALLFSFIAVLLATLGSLFYSEIAGFEPCKLCWFQRIFMYPQVILLGVALWKKDRGIIPHSITLSSLGAVIAGYHYLLQLGVAPALPCSAVGYSASCSQRFVLQFGYITIPLMALTAFLLVVVLMAAAKRVDKTS